MHWRCSFRCYLVYYNLVKSIVVLGKSAIKVNKINGALKSFLELFWYVFRVALYCSCTCSWGNSRSPRPLWRAQHPKCNVLLYLITVEITHCYKKIKISRFNEHIQRVIWLLIKCRRLLLNFCMVLWIFRKCLNIWRFYQVCMVHLEKMSSQVLILLFLFFSAPLYM